MQSDRRPRQLGLHYEDDPHWSRVPREQQERCLRLLVLMIQAVVRPALAEEDRAQEVRDE